jgi:hypothetical protein
MTNEELDRLETVVRVDPRFVLPKHHMLLSTHALALIAAARENIKLRETIGEFADEKNWTRGSLFLTPARKGSKFVYPWIYARRTLGLVPDED